MIWRIVFILSLIPLGSDGPLAEAMVNFNAGRYAQAVESLHLARDQYPDLSPTISYNLGLVYLRMDSIERAREAFYQSLSPSFPQTASLASNQLALLLLEEGRPREALGTFREALLFDPTHEDARYNFELLALRLGQQTPPPASNSPQNPPPSEQPENRPEDNSPQNIDPKMQKLLNKLEQRQRQTVPPGDQPIAIGNDTLTMAEAYQILELMRKRERQYLQQLRKISSASAEREGRPSW
ncbi:MAG: tetratricopeptide repeat protein [Bacteroidia bacterium]|nr:tetratricopeptide repeat protein [Bacteroidia bacterium]